MKVKMFAVIAVLVVCLALVMTAHNQYELEAVVVEANGAVVTVEDSTSNLWDYEVDGDAVPVVGTQVTLFMQDMSTESIYDDQIVGVE
jgi:hypothetical protein